MSTIIDSGLRTQDSGLRTQDSTRLLSRIKSLVKYPIRIVQKTYRHLLNTKCRYKFHDRRKNSSTLIIILAGYKPFVWEDVFTRIKAFAPSEADFCIVSSGKYDANLADIAAKNEWSYLSIRRNCVSLAQNKAILLHPSAEFIYKLDEDIFVTKHSFSFLMKTYRKVLEDDIYEPGFIAPLLPINGYAHVRVLEKLGLTDVYTMKFEKPKQRGGMVWVNPEVAKFLWGEGGFVPSIDEMAERFYSDVARYTICPVRFSIGFILFRRELWQNMGMFTVPLKGVGMGTDESQICCRAMSHSQAVIVSDNAVAGHLSFGPQNDAMKEYYLKNREKFRLP